MGKSGKRKKTGNNKALQGQEVQSLDISGTCFHPHSLYSCLLPPLPKTRQQAARWMGWALQDFQKRTESDCCSTWGAKTKEPSLPVGLWESRLWSGPERESSLMKYWCFFFNCVLWELSLLLGCVRWSTILLRARLYENRLDRGAQGVLSALIGPMMTPHSGPELVKGFFYWSKEQVHLISRHPLQNTYTADMCLTSKQKLDSKPAQRKSSFGDGRVIVCPWNKGATASDVHAVSAQLKLNNGVGKLFLNSRGLFTLRLFWPSIQILIQSKHRVISDWMLGKFAISSYESDPYS